ncbi:MAG: DUF5686 family protein [candidate division KSB1 bacterium]|nr:DUF5686 family protein [candidate division KSB1 bacterium]
MQRIYLKQALFLLIMTLALLLIISAFILSHVNGMTVETLTRDKGKIIRFYNDTVVEEEEKLRGDVVITHANITIKGKVYGNVIAIFGNIEVRSDGMIYGHAIAYRGEIAKNREARIAGDLLEISPSGINYSTGRDFKNFDRKLNRFSGNTVIARDEKIRGDVVVVNGDLVIKGEIEGSVCTFLGDILVKPSGTIAGHAISYKGKVDKEPGSNIVGEILEIPSGISSQDFQEKFTDRDLEIRQEIETKFLQKHGKKKNEVVRFFGDVVVEKDEVLEGDVVVMKGTIAIKGEVEGNVVAIWGDVDLASTGYVEGDVVSVGGKVRRESGSYVGGDVVETSWRGVQIEMDEDEHYMKIKTPDVSMKHERDDQWQRRPRKSKWYRIGYKEEESFVFRYNRVEGLFLGLRLPKTYWSDRSYYNFAIYGEAGYGFANKAMRYQIGAEKWFENDFRFALGAEAHNLTDTQDEWIIPSLENSLAALFLKEDFQDFYRREGFSVYATQNFTPALLLGAEYRSDCYYNMPNQTNWALFGKKKKFRENPLIDEIEMNSVVGKVCLDTRNDLKHPDQGWYITLLGEFARPEYNNEEPLNFDRYIFDLRRYQPLGRGENLDFRIRVGTARGELPIQFKFDLGGLSTLRGYDFKEFENGDRMVLGNVEYRIHGRRSRFHDVWWLENLNLILFADTGWLWNSEDKSSYKLGFKHLTWSDLKTDIGIALSDEDGNVRFNVAKRVDVSGKPVVVTFRLNRTF